MTRELLGKYFVYCQWCKNDGNCVLLHHEFMGAPSQGEVDKSSYPGHEDLAWHLSALQGGSSRSTCNGRIIATGSCFYPLACKCGTAISSLTFSNISGGYICRKFQPNEKGKKRLEISQKIIVRRKAKTPKLFFDEEDDYKAEMMS